MRTTGFRPSRASGLSNGELRLESDALAGKPQSLLVKLNDPLQDAR